MPRTTDLGPNALVCTVPGAAERLGCSPSTVYKLMGSGELRSVKVMGKRLIPLQAIEEFLAPSA